jgi:hypothetical protein
MYCLHHNANLHYLQNALKIKKNQQNSFKTIKSLLLFSFIIKLKKSGDMFQILEQMPISTD